MTTACFKKAIRTLRCSNGSQWLAPSVEVVGAGAAVAAATVVFPSTPSSFSIHLLLLRLILSSHLRDAESDDAEPCIDPGERAVWCGASVLVMPILL